MRAAAELRSVASLASVILREGLSERAEFAREKVGPATGEPRVGIEVPADGSMHQVVEDSTVVPVGGGVSVTAGKTKPFDKSCRNSDYHWKGPCRFCGGGEPA